MGWTKSPAFPYKALGFETKKDLIDHPQFYDHWVEHNVINVSSPSLKAEIVKVKLHIEKEKQRTFMAAPGSDLVTNISLFGEASDKIVELGKKAASTDTWSFYGWCPFFLGVDNLAKRLIGYLREGYVIPLFDVSGYDRKLSLTYFCSHIRLMFVENYDQAPDWYKEKVRQHLLYDAAPCILVPWDIFDGNPPDWVVEDYSDYLGDDGNFIKDMVYRNTMNSSGKGDTTVTNSLCHFIIKKFHHSRCSLNSIYLGIYSDDNFEVLLPYDDMEADFRFTYRLFDMELRDFEIIRSYDELISSFKFLGFGIVQHWRRSEYFAPKYDLERVYWSFFQGEESTQFQKYWGLLLLAYAGDEGLFRKFMGFQNLVREHPDECKLTQLLWNHDRIYSFFDMILFGDEGCGCDQELLDEKSCFTNFLQDTLVPEVAGIKNDHARPIRQTKKDNEIESTRTGSSVETVFSN